MATNICIFDGYAGSDAEMRFTPSGKSVTSFRFAVPQGRGKESAWFKVTAWGSDNLREGQTDYSAWVNDNVRKGDHIQLHGKATCDSYTDKEGVKRLSYGITVDPWGITYVVKSPTDAANEDDGSAHALSQPVGTTRQVAPSAPTGQAVPPTPARQRPAPAQAAMAFADDDDYDDDVPFD